MQEIRAFPHVAELTKARLEFAERLPAVFRLFIDEYRAAWLLFIRLRSDDKIASAVTMEQIGIAEMACDPGRTIRHGNLVFCHRAIFLQGAKALSRRADALVLGIAGIEYTHLAVVRKTAT